ncbi:hypothetical protein H0H87_008636 [Tephrocybe sp. NHM501043]|nr:hypothetical protein H0H87_008636 [Tephrocybe sp. NHM501043]
MGLTYHLHTILEVQPRGSHHLRSRRARGWRVHIQRLSGVFLIRYLRKAFLNRTPPSPPLAPLYIDPIVPPVLLHPLRVLRMVPAETHAAPNLREARARVGPLPDRADEPLEAAAAPRDGVEVARDPRRLGRSLAGGEHVRDGACAVGVARVGVGAVAARAVPQGVVGALEGAEGGEEGGGRGGVEERGDGVQVGGGGLGLEEEAEDVVARGDGACEGGLVDLVECGPWDVVFRGVGGVWELEGLYVLDHWVGVGGAEKSACTTRAPIEAHPSNGCKERPQSCAFVPNRD